MGGNERCHHKISKGDAMLEERFQEVYSKFKLHFYQETFARFQTREASLTTVETFAMETIYALGSPTVHEFAEFMRISSSNAAYKIASLIRKGYVRKVQSENDAREYHLCPRKSTSSTTTSARRTCTRWLSASRSASRRRSSPRSKRCSPWYLRSSCPR